MPRSSATRTDSAESTTTKRNLRQRDSTEWSPLSKSDSGSRKESIFIFNNRQFGRKISRDHLSGSSRSIDRIWEEADDSASIISSECQDIDVGVELQNNLQNLSLQVQEIWPTREITKCLSCLPGSQELLNTCEQGDVSRILLDRNARQTGVLLASWLGNKTLLQNLLEAGGKVEARDCAGRTPLHLASCSGQSDCVATLLQHKASPNIWDAHNIATPLHCAASVGNVECLQLLLEAGANLDAGLSSTGGGKSPLHYAVQSNAISCLQILIQKGAQVNISQVYTETPLHVAAGLGFAECTRILLENGADSRVLYGAAKSTPLHLAAEDGNAECARLLLEAGANINITNTKLQTPLHLAALAQSAKTLELLLKNKSRPNAPDIDRRTPLHCAIVKGSKSCECVKLLLQYGAEVNAADAFGYTPVHIAALNDFSNCLKLLLDHGGDVTRKTNGNVSALSFIARRTPEILRYIEMKLDEGVKLYDHEIGDTDCEVQLDFHILVPDSRSGETGLLLTFIEVGQRRLLRHPLCQTFLCLKWRRIRKYFILSLIVHAIYVLLCSIYILNIFLIKNVEDDLTAGFIFLNIVLVIANIGIFFKELFQIAHSRTGYVYQWENWLQWLIMLTTFVTLIPPSWVPEQAVIQHHISVFGIFFNWIELMVLMGRFPMFGIYVQMFTNGTVNFSKFLLAYCCLLVAFAFSFRMTFPGYKAFQDISVSFVKTMVMMTGELEFEDIFFADSGIPPRGRGKSVFIPNNNVPYPVTAHIFFLFFTIVVAIVLTNLLVGLSVSDIQGLQRSAGLDRLARQVELVAYMESMFYSRLLHWVPTKLLLFCRRSASLMSSPRRRKLIVRPNDPRENRIPKELVKAVYACVAEKKPGKNKKRQLKNEDESRTFSTYQKSIYYRL